MEKRLVPLIVVALLVALIWWPWSGSDGPVLDVDSDVRACRDNLQAIYDGLREYQERFGETPTAPGVGFFASLVARGVWTADDTTLERLTCPGPGALPVPAGTDYSDLASLTPASSAYAGRDTVNHPLTKFPAGGPASQALVACDNAEGSNHDGVINVLYTDRTVRTFELAKRIEEGELPAGATSIPVGPDSPLEDLRVLVGERP